VIGTAVGYHLIFVFAALSTLYASATLVRAQHDRPSHAAVAAPPEARGAASA